MHHVPRLALFSAKRWRLHVLTFLIKGFGFDTLEKYTFFEISQCQIFFCFGSHGPFFWKNFELKPWILPVFKKISLWWAFHSILVNSFLVVFGDKVTKMLCNSLFIFHFVLPILPCKRKTSYRKSHNLSDEKPKTKLPKYMMSRAMVSR